MNDQSNLPAERKPQLHTGAAVAALVPQTLDEAYRLADAMSRSGLTPNGIKTPEAVMVAIMAGAELGLPPFQACQSFAIINGRPSVWGDAIPALLWSNGFKIKEWFDDAAADYPDAMTARCEITRPDGEIIAGEFSVADAKEGLLWSKAGPWQTSKKRMLKMRARSFAARDGAADLLRGLYVAEEAEDIPATTSVTEGTGMAARLAARAQAVDIEPDGFNVRKIADETASAAPKTRGKAKGKAQAVEEVKTAEAVTEPDDAHTAPAEADEHAEFEDISDGLTGGVVASGGKGNHPQDQASDAPAADVASPEPEFVADASEPLEEADASASVEEIETTTAEPDEVYIWAEDATPADDRVTTYKNGIPFSSVSLKAAMKLKTHDHHAPTVEVEEPVVEEDQGAEEVAQNPFIAAIYAIGDAASYLGAKQVVRKLMTSEAWVPAEDGNKRTVRQALWDQYARLREEKRETCTVTSDFTLMRLFLEFGAGTSAEIDEIWPTFWRSPTYKEAKDGDKKAISTLMEQRKQALDDAS